MEENTKFEGDNQEIHSQNLLESSFAGNCLDIFVIESHSNVQWNGIEFKMSKSNMSKHPKEIWFMCLNFYMPRWMYQDTSDQSQR